VANFVDDLEMSADFGQILRTGLSGDEGDKEEYHFQFIWYSGQCAGEA
jgi:hypothetical protein